MSKTLTKTNSSNKWLGGVIGGISKHYNLDPTIPRFIFLILVLSGFSFLILIYLFCVFFMPDENV